MTRSALPLPVYKTDAARWAAVMRRDKRADGRFLFSVRTTGIYCRPSCPARHAQRENVAFHASCEAAERAGFRACKRCRPDDRQFDARHSTAIAQACRTIETSTEPPPLAALAANAGMSRFHFHRLFKQATGVTPREYAASHRTARVREKLTRGATVTRAIYDAGFNSASNFYATANEALGMTPVRYRAGGKQESIRFGTAPCTLGTLLVAATARGICAISLGDNAQKLVRELKAMFPHAAFIGADREFARLLKTVIRVIDRPHTRFDLPLDIRGTAFQQRVWQALRKIPAGATVTYTDIARRIGAPQAVRAVAHACASNTLAVAIPCHRVVRTTGELAGYRWGIERKRELLKRESTNATPQSSQRTQRRPDGRRPHRT